VIRLRAAQPDRRDEHQHVHDQVHLRGHRGEDPVRVRDARYEGIEQGDERDDGALRRENAHLDAPGIIYHAPPTSNYVLTRVAASRRRLAKELTDSV
jgi:hypothetical protein